MKGDAMGPNLARTFPLSTFITFKPFGAWHYFSTAPKPYRPHLPHPEFYRLVGYGAVEIIGTPTNPHSDNHQPTADC